MWIQWVVQVLAQVCRRSAAPVLKHMQIGLSFKLQGERRERGQRYKQSIVFAATGQHIIWPQHFNKQKTANTHFL